MLVDEELLLKTKAIIPNRTQDYEDYMRRRILASNRAELLKMEIDDIDARREHLMNEYDIEIGLIEKQKQNERTKQDDVNAALEDNLKYYGYKWGYWFR